jgi:hypothetical protein
VALVAACSGIGAIFAIGGLVSNDVVLLSWLIAAHGAAYFFTSAWILARRGLPHRRLTIMGAAGGIAIAIVAAFAAG